MTNPKSSALGTAEKLRQEFDLSFARPPQTESAPGVDLLCFRVADVVYAMKMKDTAGVLVDKSIATLPSDVPGYLGVLSHRGELVPVYSMHRLLGHKEGVATRWLILLRAPHVVALTFDGYEGQHRVSETDLIPARNTGPGAAYVQHMTRVGEQVRPLVSIPELLKEIEHMNGLNGKRKEA